MIREAKPEDLVQIMELFRLILEDMEHPIILELPWEDLKDLLVKAGNLKGCPYSYHHALVKDVDGEVAGFCFGYLENLEEDEESLKEIVKEYGISELPLSEEDEAYPDEWYLDSLVVKEQYRGQGISKEIIEAASNKAKESGYVKIGLNCDKENRRAKVLYEKMGFKTVGEVRLQNRLYDHMQKEVG